MLNFSHDFYPIKKKILNIKFLNLTYKFCNLYVWYIKEQKIWSLALLINAQSSVIKHGNYSESGYLKYYFFHENLMITSKLNQLINITIY